MHCPFFATYPIGYTAKIGLVGYEIRQKICDSAVRIRGKTKKIVLLHHTTRLIQIDIQYSNPYQHDSQKKKAKVPKK